MIGAHGKVPFAGLMALLVAAATLPAGCNHNQSGRQEMPAAEIAQVIAEHAPALMEIPGVVGVAEGRTAEDRTCLRIYVVRLDDNLRSRLPSSLGGYPVEVEESGEIRPLGGD